MRAAASSPLHTGHGASRLRVRWERSIAEFLRMPLGLLGGFIALAVVTVLLDTGKIAQLRVVHRALDHLIPTDSANRLLTAIATSVVTITSITFSVLLLAVQQSASSFTPVVFEQFLRRRTNQLYFGFFVGLSFYCFLVMAVLRPDTTPAVGTAVALVLFLVALIMLVLIIYGTIDQMRPGTVVDSIHALALRARRSEGELLARTRGAPRLEGPRMPITATESGYVIDIDLQTLKKAAESASGEIEIVLEVQIGSHLVFGDTVAAVVGARVDEQRRICDAVRVAVSLDHLRDIDVDAGYAVDELENIAWSGASSAQHSPETALTAVKAIRDVLARWAAVGSPDPDRYGGEVPVVYLDGVVLKAIDSLTSVCLVTAESRQHQTCAEILTAFAATLPHLDPAQTDHVNEAINLVLPAVVEHAYSAPLERALDRLRRTLAEFGYHTTAGKVAEATQRLRSATEEIHPKPWQLRQD